MTKGQSRRGSAELPAPDCECGQSFNPMYHADTVHQLLAHERRKALEEAAFALESRMIGVAHYKRVGLRVGSDFIRSMIDKGPT